MKLILRFIALKMSILRVDAAIIKRKKVKRNGYEKVSVRDNDKKNHLEMDTLDGYRESDTCRFT